ncbi:MAG: peptidylprolyl isomerase, partial [Odoribacter sp.]|nr:peptidylprolyl isomerase [Odoribacter sp.]
EGFYDGILFHRVINNFMIQAGDPDSKNAPANNILGANGADYKLDAEILPQFFHKRGVLAAAREGDNVNPERKSSGSHFYIVQGRKYSEEELDKHVKGINDNRRAAIFERLKNKYEGDINKYTSEEDFDTLMEINEKISEETAVLLEKEKLVLTDEQKEAYTKVGGTPHLDGQYTVFGEVIEGMDIVDKISFVETDMYSRPLQDVKIIKIKNTK